MKVKKNKYKKIIFLKENIDILIIKNTIKK